MKSKLILAIVLVFLSFSLLISAVQAVSRGTGTLYAYSDASYTTLLPNDSSAGGTAMSVTNGQTIYIRITAISEFAIGDSINVVVKWGGGGHHATLGPSAVKTLTSGEGAGTLGVEVSWVVGLFDGPVVVYIPYCETMVVDYGIASDSYNALNAFASSPPQGHLHVIPEYLYGGLAAMAACFGGLIVFKSRNTFLAKIHK